MFCSLWRDNASVENIVPCARTGLHLLPG
jgi:hypothetical protein